LDLVAQFLFQTPEPFHMFGDRADIFLNDKWRRRGRGCPAGARRR
jgi:hypothetical protein